MTTVAAVPEGYLAPVHARWLADDPDRRRRSVPGTLVFADVSGFTALAERLARRGQMGTEELTEAIDTVYRGMLGAVRNRGGELLKFGGDAVLALFTGDRHEARGCAAALGMQDVIRSAGKLRTAAGRVTLRLSAGVASGELDLFLAGGTPREMIVAGPLASEVVACESAAEAGQVLVSERTAEVIGRRFTGADRLLRSAPPVAVVDCPTAPSAFDPRPGLPLHLHDHVPEGGEHRTVTVAFLQFRGTDDLLEREGPDAVAGALDGIVGAASEACLAYGVTFVATDVDRNAGKIILAAGAPTASPDDDDRMLHALGAVVRRPWPLQVRAGVNRGRVFTVDIGPPERRTWTVMGDAVNLAARVMGRAEPGQVLATRTVLDRVRDDFARTPIDPFMVKGKSAPVVAEAVGAVAGARRAAPDVDAPLVGRERELGILDDALTAARAGERRLVEIAGEAGIGKSRLLDALRVELADTPTILIRGGPYSAHTPYRAVQGPLRELIGCPAAANAETVAAALRARVAELEPRLEPWLPLVGVPFGVELPATEETAALAPEFARARLHAVTGRLIDRLLPAGALTALIVEDGHWLDEASGDFIRSLVAAARPGGSFVVTTRRAAGDGLRIADLEDATLLELGPIDPAALIAHLDEPDLPPGTVERIVERAAGNPLLLQELLAAARAGEDLEALPDSVEALVTTRIDTLPRSDRRLLREASVLGNQLGEDVLGELLGLDGYATRAAVERLDDFLVPADGHVVRFRHALLRDAAYQMLAFRRRRELHARAASIIERRAGERLHESAELVAIHYHEARYWSESWLWSRVAADRALARAAPLEAAAFLRRAMAAARAMDGVPVGDVAEVAEKLGDAAMLAGHHDEAGRAYGDALRRRHGQPEASAILCRKIGRLREKSASISQALGWYTRGLHHLEGHEQERASALRGRLTLAHGAARMRAGRLRECLPYLERALAEGRASGDRPTIAHACALLDATLTDLGDPRAREYRDLALPIYEELGDHEGMARVLGNLGANAYYEGRWEEAVDCYERGRAAAERLGDVVEAAMGLVNIAEIRSDQGHLDEAETMLREALRTLRSSHYRIGIGAARMHLGRLLARRGDLEAGEEELERARTTLLEAGIEWLALEVEARQAELRLFANDPAGALRLCGEIRARARRLGAAPTLLAGLQRVSGWACLQAGDPDGARTRFEESLELARSVAAAYEEARALQGLAATGGPEAAEAVARAGAILSGLGVVA